jgi:signal peptidase I
VKISLRTLLNPNDMKKISFEKRYIIYASILLLCVIIPALPYIKVKTLEMPFIVSLYWCILICIMLFILPWLYIPVKNPASKYLVGYGLSGGIIFIALKFVPAVFMKKLGASPYDTSIPGIFVNALTIIPAITAKEMIRYYSFASAYKTLKYKRTAVFLITIIMCLVEINFGNLLSIKEFKELFIYSTQILLPIAAKNILMSVFVFYGGVLSSVVYIGIIQIFEKCFPVLPELSWLLDGAIGIAFPIVYAMFISDHVFATVRKRSEDKKSDVMYLISLLAATAFAWFCVGVFPVYPSVILTGSMEPLIMPGDVVLVHKISNEDEIYELSKGDIINFKRGNIIITHRIKEVLKDEAGNLSFETKGDNNNAIDEEKVQPNDIKGIVIKVVPKIGLPTLILKGQDKIPEGVIDN